MTGPIEAEAQPKPTPAYAHFRFTNAFQWVLDAHAAGFSRADIRFVLDTLELTEPLRRALEADAEKREA